MARRSANTIDERALVQSAVSAIQEKDLEKSQVVKGKPLPEDFVNPEPGEPGHKCLDPEGNYQPDWTCLHIHRVDDGTPNRQFFAAGSRTWRVRTGEWVDVPPDIIEILRGTTKTEIEMDITKANPISDRGVEKVIRKIPRFSTSQMSSA